MALVLTLKQGEDFYVDKDQYFLREIVSAGQVRVARVRDGAAFDVDDQKRTQVDAGVFLQIGDHMTSKACRLMIQAPRQMLIVTGAKKRNPPPSITGRPK
jgi:hypothetical protein